MKYLTTTLFIISFLLFACQAGEDNRPHSERLVGTWLYQKEHLGEIEYREDGTAVSHAEEDYSYTWKIDQADSMMTTVDDFTTTKYQYSFVGKDTLNLEIIQMEDKNGNEVPHYTGQKFELIRK